MVWWQGQLQLTSVLYGYIDCVMTINDLIDRSDFELFKKVCSASHSLYHLLTPHCK